MKKIKLTQGKYALVDDKDFEYLNQWKWTYDNTTGYAMRNQYLKEKYKNGKSKFKKNYMHKLINKSFNNLDTDHINRNKLDNRKVNLRSVSRSINCINRNKSKFNTSGYTGINWDKQTNKWRARIGKKSLGRYETIMEAYYKRKAAELAMSIIFDK